MMGLPDCSEVARQLSRDYDQGRDLGHGVKLRLHLLMCRACRHYRRYLEWLAHNLPRALAAAPDTTLSVRQREHIRQALYDRLQ